MTLTKEALAEKCKPTSEKMEIPGFGDVYVRSVSELQRSRRVARLFGSDQAANERNRGLRRVHSIIDQVVDENGDPLFRDTPEDVEFLCSLDGNKLDPLVAAIQQFNGDLEKKEPDESAGGETNSSETGG